jgi:UMF1 family MFS transporter
MYDWANSAFATVILAAVLPVYFAGIVPADGVAVFWSADPVPATAFWGYTVSLSMAIVALTAPGIGNLADRRGWRRPLLMIFCTIGALSTCALWLTGPGQYWQVAFLFILGNIGFAAGNIFYNAFLPGLAAGQEADRLSAHGFAFGYLGGGLVLLVVFLLIKSYAWFGFEDIAQATRFGFLLTGAWWLGFAMPCFLWVRDGSSSKVSYAALRGPGDYIRAFLHLKQYPDLLRFLIAFLLYNDGIQTIIAVSAIFAREELGLGQGTILGCFLMIQFIATPGALLFARLAGRWGARNAILACLAIFSIISLYASAMNSAAEFWVLGFVVALVLGGSQAISRSFFASMVPGQRSAEFFGFYAISSKFASILGPFMFALLIQMTGSNRIAILALAGFFILGMALLLTVNVRRGQELVLSAED